jgi:hypothetical protein
MLVHQLEVYFLPRRHLKNLSLSKTAEQFLGSCWVVQEHLFDTLRFYEVVVHVFHSLTPKRKVNALKEDGLNEGAEGSGVERKAG